MGFIFGPISYETIYARIYQDKQQGGDLHRHLRHKIKSYKNRSLQNDCRGQIKGAVSTEQRPAIVEQRVRIGDWELDTVIGKASVSVLVTMVKRYSRCTIIAKAANRSHHDVSMTIMTSSSDIETSFTPSPSTTKRNFSTTP